MKQLGWKEGSSTQVEGIVAMDRPTEAYKVAVTTGHGSKIRTEESDKLTEVSCAFQPGPA